MKDKMKPLFLRKSERWDDLPWSVRFKDIDGEETNYAMFTTRLDARKFLRIKWSGYRRAQ